MTNQQNYQCTGFQQYLRGSNRETTLLAGLRQEMGVRTATSVISVGCGDGRFDSALIHEAFPGLKRYTGVELDPTHFSLLKARMAKLETDRLTVDLHNCGVEDFPGPKEPADLVLMLHVIYYCPDRAAEIIQRAMDWLLPGGTLVIAVTDFTSLNAFPCEKNPTIWSKLVRAALQKQGLQAKEVTVSHTLHIAGLDHEFVDFIRLGKSKESDVPAVLGMLEVVADPVTRTVPFYTKLFVVQKA